MYSFSAAFILKIPKPKVNRFLNTTLCKRALPSPDDVLQIDGFKSRLPLGTYCPCRSKDSEDPLEAVRGSSNAGAWALTCLNLPALPTDGPADLSPQGLPQSHLPPFGLTKRSRQSWTAARREGIWQCDWPAAPLRGGSRADRIWMRTRAPHSRSGACRRPASVLLLLPSWHPFRLHVLSPSRGPRVGGGDSVGLGHPLPQHLPSPPFFPLKCSNHCFSNHCSNHWDFLFETDLWLLKYLS